MSRAATLDSIECSSPRPFQDEHSKELMLALRSELVLPLSSGASRMCTCHKSSRSGGSSPLVRMKVPSLSSVAQALKPILRPTGGSAATGLPWELLALTASTLHRHRQAARCHHSKLR